MAFFSCVMAFAATWPVSSWQDLFDAIYSPSLQDGDVISFQNDITFPSDKQGKTITEATGYGTLCIRKSITIEGNNYSLTGSGKRSNGTYVTLGINQAGTQAVAVTIQNLAIINNKSMGRALECRGTTAQPITALTLTNCYLSGQNGTLTIGRSHTNKPLITITNSTINGNGSYPILTFNPFIMNIDNSTISGYCGIYFKSPDGSAGSRGAVVTATNSNFNCPNGYSGAWNSFGVFALEDDGITITLNNCGVDARALKSARSTLITLSPWAPIGRRANDVTLNINGDNSYVMGQCVSAGWDLYYAAKDAYDVQKLSAQGDFKYNVYENGTVINSDTKDTILVKDENYVFGGNTAKLHINVTGGTYAYNPEKVKYTMHEYEGEDEAKLALNEDSVRIPDGYEVKEIETQQGGLQTTLYRVRKKITTSNSINDNVEGQGAGQNENTEFLISANETVEQASTVANYVEVSNNATLTLPEGKKLEVTNGLDVTDGATLDVAAGSTLVVGEGGVTSENTGSIVIESNENGSASFLLSPEVIVNTTPNLTVKMTVKGKGYKNESAGKTYYWHRFAAPVVMAEAWSKAPDYGTWLYGWDYSAEGGKGAWAELPTSMAMVPFQGYTLSPEHLVASEDEEIVYSFKGQLAGNQNINLQFNARGFNFFGNSYTGYISVLTLVDQLMGNENIDGTVYMWKNNGQGYQPVSLKDLEENPSHYEAWEKEIAPMQTFILRQINTGEGVSTLLNYENSIWNNPRYGNVPAPAPKRAAANADPFVRVMITAANGQNSQMSFVENADRSDDFEKGYDALVYMNENTINLYSSLEGQDLANVATNDLEGKTLTLQTNDEIAYTMSFPIVEGEKYAIRDNATGKVIAIEEGATYEFAAQPNTTVEGRFEIVPVAKVPTAIENTEVKANAKGIYTLTGQYLGEDFEAVPAGVYVVNGVKIVK